jgi:hypothetical protein
MMDKVRSDDPIDPSGDPKSPESLNKSESYNRKSRRAPRHFSSEDLWTVRQRVLRTEYYVQVEHWLHSVYDLEYNVHEYSTV